MNKIIFTAVCCITAAAFFTGCASNTYRGVDLLNGNVNKAGESTERNAGAGDTVLENTVIRWYIDSAPRGARVFYRVISFTGEVQNTNESYLGVTPLEETKSFDIRASVTGVSPGPVVTRYEIKPDPGVTIASITARTPKPLAVILCTFSTSSGSEVMVTRVSSMPAEATAAPTATLTFFGKPLMASLAEPAKTSSLFSSRVAGENPASPGAPARLWGFLKLSTRTIKGASSPLARSCFCLKARVRKRS